MVVEICLSWAMSMVSPPGSSSCSLKDFVLLGKEDMDVTTR